MNAALSHEERLARIRLNGFSYLRADWCARLMEFCGSAQEILGKDAGTIAREGGISPKTAESFLKEALALDPEKELDKTAQLGGKILLLGDDDYPAPLSEIADPPLVLYVLGKISFSKPAIAVVGTRKPTPYGRRMAAKLSRELSGCGAVIVSGLARGIDSVSHEAALSASGQTWAVIGTGLGRCYPAENRQLAHEIAEKGGAIISEFPVEKPPLPFHFPRRNRIISGLSCAVVVIEGEATSGALITAKLALEQGKEVLAVPGPADSPQSEGPNSLIKNGAGVARSARDVIDSIPSALRFGLTEPPAPQEESAAEGGQLSPDAASLLGCLGGGEATLDELVEKTGWPVPRAASALFELEARTFISCCAGVYGKR